MHDYFRPKVHFVLRDVRGRSPGDAAAVPGVSQGTGHVHYRQPISLRYGIESFCLEFVNTFLTHVVIMLII